MNRRAAITALVAAVPGLAFAGESPLLTTSSTDLTIRQTPRRIAAIFRADGCIEIPLDGWSGWRVTFGGESVDISAAEVFEALRPSPRADGDGE